MIQGELVLRLLKKEDSEKLNAYLPYFVGLKGRTHNFPNLRSSPCG